MYSLCLPCVNIEVPGDKVAPHLLDRLLLLLPLHQVHVRRKPVDISKIFSKTDIFQNILNISNISKICAVHQVHVRRKPGMEPC